MKAVSLGLAGLLFASLLYAQTLHGGVITVQRLPQGDHFSVQAASAANGAFALAWSSTDDWRHGPSGLFVQLFAADGTPKGEPFQVGGLGIESGPEIAMAADGRFVVAWEEVIDIHHTRVFGCRFDAQGQPLGDRFALASPNQTISQQTGQSVSMAADGSFVAAWASGPQPHTHSFDIYARRFDAEGRPLGLEFLVNTTKLGARDFPLVAMRPAGGFLIGWTTNAGGRTVSDVNARRFAADGSPLGGEFRANTGPTVSAWQSWLQIAVSTDGSFVAIWQDSRADRVTFELADTDGLLGQRYTADGRPAGPVFHVNATTPGVQSTPAIATVPGGFFVSWSSLAPAYSKTSIFGRRFSSDGVPLGGEITIDAFSPGQETAPALALSPDGRGVVAWIRSDNDGVGSELLMRLLQP